MREMNGFSKKGFTLIEVMVVILLIAILASIAISYMVHTRQKAYIRTVESDLKSAYKAAYNYFSDKPEGTVTRIILETNGYRQSKDVNLSIIDGSKGNLLITAVHPRVPGIYRVDYRGRVSK